MSLDGLFNFFYHGFTYGIFAYSVLLIFSYLFIGIYSIGETRKYIHKNRFTDYRLLAASQHAPSVSILAPAYNEGKTIVENVRSLLSIYYNNLELIVINDGSKDDSLQRLIDAYELEGIDFFIDYQIPSKPIKRIYKSRNAVYSKLIVVDKVNGGKADALNAGINIASNNYLVCIDVDCILEQDALLKMIKPFLEQTDAKVIASGGVIRIANSCVIENGQLVKVRLPKKYLPRMQTLEYIRAFILGRMAWSRLNGLMLISGAFGAFDREIVIKCGGYNHNTVGEDMELVVRMRRYMEEQKIKYRVTYVPDPLCWTEAPEALTILGRQRNRWARGTFETLKFHKKMFFNPRYHLLGLLSYPYWFFFEMCAPIIEFFGFIFFFVFALSGLIDWEFFLIYLLFIISFGYLYSAFAVLMEVLSYHQYKRRIDVLRILLTALTEPFYFHPFVVWSAILGFKDLIKKKSSWGEMTRQGFASATPVAAGQQPGNFAPTAGESAGTAHAPGAPVRNKWRIAGTAFYQSFRDYLRFAILLYFLSLAGRAFELISDTVRHGIPQFAGRVIMLAFLKDLAFFMQAACWGFVVFGPLYLVHKKTARSVFVLLAVVFLFIQIGLSQYFLTTLVPLGADLWGYSWAEIRQTIATAGGIPLPAILAFAGMLLLILFVFIYGPKRIKPGKVFTMVVLLLLVFSLLFPMTAVVNRYMPGAEYSNNLSINKSWYFYHSSLQHWFPVTEEQDIYSDAYVGDGDAGATKLSSFTYSDERQYPFLHSVDTMANTLSPFFNKAPVTPNIVIILVEGLGRAFTNRGAYLGNFTPFLDSLSGKSLYWENFLSEGGRTFAVLPSLIGSLPFAKNGWNELGEKMPSHLSLLSLLRSNGYRTGFYYGGDSHFDNMDLFLQRGKIDSIYDENTFPGIYTKMPSTTGFTWGYGDKELFRRYFETKSNPQQPYASVVLTVSTHSPFFINEQEQYLQKFEQRMNELGFDGETQKHYQDYKYQYASILFMDDAIHNFFKEYAARADFKNTVFLITGDHRMPEIPMSSKIDRYHVPLLVYSPLLKRTAKFSSISTHFDITPSLLMWLRHDYHLQIPLSGSWMGSGLDTARSFRNIHAYPLMQTKNDLIDFVMGEYMLNGNDLYRIGSGMQLTPEQDDSKAATLRAAFDRFKAKNEKITGGAPIIPDSLYRSYAPK
ncbi:MAG TPA: sulfatase-like hydrolase/transferase [Puia sp.]|nr:sulfatase-like hydrolase/transferase [Puia sp.]